MQAVLHNTPLSEPGPSLSLQAVLHWLHCTHLRRLWVGWARAVGVCEQRLQSDEAGWGGSRVSQRRCDVPASAAAHGQPERELPARPTRRRDMLQHSAAQRGAPGWK